MDIQILQALADPVRFQIVEALREGELPVNALLERVEIQQSGVSRHLRILHEAGLVQVRPDAQRRLYSLRTERFRELDEWISRYRAVWDARLDRLALAVERKQRARNRRRRET